MFDRRLYQNIDWLLIAALSLLCAIGLSMIYSTTGGFSSLYVVQLYSVALGVIAFLVCISIDYRKLTENSHLIYLGILALLVYVLLFGVVRGSGLGCIFENLWRCTSVETLVVFWMMQM